VPNFYAAMREIIAGGNTQESIFLNPTGSGVIAKPYRFHAFDSMSGIVSNLVYGFVKTGAALTPVQIHGQALTRTGPTPPNGQCGFMAITDSLGIAGGYFWESVFGDQNVGAGAVGIPNEIDEEFPPLLLYPGTFIAFYVLNASAHWFHNMWWEEIRIT
jgi:hypothetical protein